VGSVEWMSEGYREDLSPPLAPLVIAIAIV
jgi:hypothetical protein